MATHEHNGGYLAAGLMLLAVIVVALGAYTRLMHAGLGCPDWPGCYGFLAVPQTPEALSLAEVRFPEHPVEPLRGWAEMIHRYLAGTLLLLGLVQAIWHWRGRHAPGQPWKLALAIAALMILQALFGMWTVTLKLWPQVVVAHLLGGFSLLVLQALLCLRLARPIDGGGRQTPLIWGAFALLLIQIALGGWTSANYAALACPDLPLCRGALMPPMDFVRGFDLAQAVGPNYLGGQLDGAARTAIHWGHRLGAVLLSLLIIAAAVEVRRRSAPRTQLRHAGRLLIAAWGLQLGLGLTNVWLGWPLLLALAHNLGAALLLLALVYVAFCYRQAPRVHA